MRQRLGFGFRARDEAFAGSALGSELTYSAAVGARLAEKRLVVGPELYGSTVVTDSSSFFGRPTSPLELIFGGHYRATAAWRLGAGAGPGLSRAFGTPSCTRARRRSSGSSPSRNRKIAAAPAEGSRRRRRTRRRRRVSRRARRAHERPGDERLPGEEGPRRRRHPRRRRRLSGCARRKTRRPEETRLPPDAIATRTRSSTTTTPVPTSPE